MPPRNSRRPMTSYRVTLYEKLIKKSFESVKLLNPNSDFEGEKSDPSNTVFVPCRLAERAHSKNKNGRKSYLFKLAYVVFSNLYRNITNLSPMGSFL